TITLAAQLVDRLTRLPAMTEGIEHAVASILAAMPDMVTARIEDAMPAVDVLAQSTNRTLHQAAKEVANLATDKAVEAWRGEGGKVLGDDDER
ncbi:hypothetical protein, partial [Pseudonocardia sp. NPDC049154]|uniref:hypothetical protein n=1 Tax=Pseudonocardia sp. NPDC049154 TaxID=3155501 RepID=UPI0033E1F7B9